MNNEGMDMNNRLYVTDRDNELDRVDFSIPPDMTIAGDDGLLDIDIMRDDMMPRDPEPGYMGESEFLDLNCLTRLSQTDLQRVRNSIEDELGANMYYNELARRFRAPQRAQIQRIAQDELSHARRFKSAYFIATGRTYNPSVPRPVVPPTRIAIRDRYNAERKDFASYLRYARETEDRCLRAIFINTARDERRHAMYFLRLMDMVQE